MTREQAFALSFYWGGVITLETVARRATKFAPSIFIAAEHRLAALAGEEPWGF